MSEEEAPVTVDGELEIEINPWTEDGRFRQKAAVEPVREPVHRKLTFKFTNATESPEEEDSTETDISGDTSETTLSSSESQEPSNSYQEPRQQAQVCITHSAPAHSSEYEEIYNCLASMNLYAPPREMDFGRNRQSIKLQRRAALELQRTESILGNECATLKKSVNNLYSLLQERQYQSLLPPILCHRAVRQLLAIDQFHSRPVNEDLEQLVILVDAIRFSVQKIAAECGPMIAGILTDNSATVPQEKQLAATIDALEQAVHEIDVRCCVTITHSVNRAAVELQESLVDTERLTAYIQRGVALLLALDPEQTCDNDDVSCLVECVFKNGERTTMEDFERILQDMLAGLVRMEDPVSLVDALCTTLKHSVESTHYQKAFDLITSSTEVAERAVDICNNTNLASTLVKALEGVCNDSLFLKVNAYEALCVICRLLLTLFGSDVCRVTGFVQGLDFSMQPSYALPHVLLVTFVGADAAVMAAQPSSDISQRFLDILSQTKKLPFFHHERVVVGCEKRLVELIRCHVVICDKAMMNELMQHTEPEAISVYSLMSSPFIQFSKFQAQCSSPKTFLLILLYSGNHATLQEQETLLGEKADNAELLVRAVAEGLSRLRLFFFTQLPAVLRQLSLSRQQQDVCIKRLTALHALLEEKLVTMAHGVIGVDFLASMEKHLGYALQHFLDLSEDQLCEVVACENSLDKYRNGFEALIDAVNGVTRGSPINWCTVDLSNRLFYIYCYARYPLEDFIRWFTDANIDLKPASAGGTNFFSLTGAEMNDIFTNFTYKREQFLGRTEMENVGFKCLQHNQASAILAVEQQTALGRHVFVKVGTGQGKSLIIALLAIKYAKAGMRVQIFTCYQHLASRDFERFATVFKQVGVEACLVKDTDSEFPKTARIVYSDLETFYQALQKHAQSRALNTLATVDTSGFFDSPEKDMCILDEFDSLIMEHNQVCNTVYRYQELLNVSRLVKSDLSSASKFLSAIYKHNPDVRETFRQQEGPFDLKSPLTRLLKQAGGWKPASKGYDALGKEVRYIGGSLTELVESHNFFSKAINVKTLAHLRIFKHVVGLSGSIGANEIKRFRSVFSQDVAYIEIPPFYGPAKSTQVRNQLRTCKRGLSLSRWKSELAQDIATASMNGRPVLVFADPACDAEWKAANDICLTHVRNLQPEASFVEIQGEENVTSKTLEHATQPWTVTLSSHVAGRGADFSVLPSVNRMGGLHVVIGFEPRLSNDSACRDARMEDQMKGRTARMDRNGSHSIITTSKLKDDPGTDITVDKVEEEVYHIGLGVYRILDALSYNPAHWRRLVLANYIFDRFADTLPDVINFVKIKAKEGEPNKRPTTRTEKIGIVAKLLIGVKPASEKRNSSCSVL